jgi:signal peptidase II
MHLLDDRKTRYLLLSLAVVVLDQWSKWLVEIRLADHEPFVVVPGFLNFIFVKNTGVAFGMFAAHGNAWGWLVLALLGVAALVLVGLYFWRTPSEDRLMLTALALIMGGAVGNLIDRIANRAVTDFIDAYLGTYHWHTFNVADSAITIGICLMALDILFGRKGPAGASSTADS